MKRLFVVLGAILAGAVAVGLLALYLTNVGDHGPSKWRTWPLVGDELELHRFEYQQQDGRPPDGP